MAEKMKAAVWYGNKDVRVEERDVKPVKDNDVKIKVSFSGICGTDLHEYEIGPLLVQVNEPNSLTGEKAPLVLGHEFSGVVEEVGKNAEKFKKGDRVVVNPVVTSGNHSPEIDRYYDFYAAGLHTDGSFAEYFIANEENVVPIPDSLSLEKAALVEPLSVAAQAVKEAEVKEGDSVAVFGAGPIGLFVIVAAKAAGAKDILAFDLSDERLAKAKEVGATEVLNTKENDAVAFIKERYPNGVDASLEVAGVKPTFDSAISSTKPKGNVVVVAIHARDFEFNPITLMTSGVKLSSSLGYEHETFKKSIEILSDDNNNVEPILTKKIKLDDIVEEGFHTLSSDLSHAKILIEIGGEN
jgi:(R,R)-butanediol dehydrogenase / meso-butanediol dehydrogenase / diacetyl reductase